MVKYIGILLIISVVFVSACYQSPTDENNSKVKNKPQKTEDGGGQRVDEPTDENTQINDTSPNDEVNQAPNTQKESTEENLDKTKQPRNVREFFMALPLKYFYVEACTKKSNRECQNEKKQYLKDFLEVEDIKNGYLSGGGDGGQGGFKMAIFKRPDNTYIVGLYSYGEMMDSYYFLDYKNGKWEDISLEVVPEFSKTNIYEFPRNGTTIPVFAKKIIEEGKGYQLTQKGEKIYDLEWKNGEFSIKR